MANVTGNKARRPNRNLDLRDMLLMSGAGQFTAEMSIPYMNMIPGTTDPYAQGVQQIVAGLQRLLNKRGGRLFVDGGMGTKTLAELVKYAGPRWYDKSWAQLMGDVIAGERWPGYEREDRAGISHAEAAAEEHEATQLAGSFLDDVMASPIPWIAGGVFVWWKWFRK